MQAHMTCHVGGMPVSEVQDLRMTEPWELSPMPREKLARLLSLCFTLSVSSQLFIPAAVGLCFALSLFVSVLLYCCLYSTRLLQHADALIQLLILIFNE